MNEGQFDTVMNIEADGGAFAYQYLKATEVINGVDESHAKDGSNHKADTSFGVSGGLLIDDIWARAVNNATITHLFYGRGESINAYANAKKPGERSYIDTAVARNTANPAAAPAKAVRAPRQPFCAVCNTSPATNAASGIQFEICRRTKSSALAAKPTITAIQT